MSRIVIVEDQEVLAAIYGKKFTAAGHEVQLAADGEAGIESINNGQPDLVVLDVMLPKLNGIEVLKKVRANPELKGLPVIVLSNAELLAQDAWKAGATMVLSKASEGPKQVLDCIDSVLQAAAREKANGDNLAEPKQSAREKAEEPTPEKTRAVQPAELPKAAELKPATNRILLVDANADLRALLSSAIQQAGYQVTMAVNRNEALEKAFLQDYDLYLINGVRADEQALQICGEIHKADAERRIVMYGLGMSIEEQTRGLDSGARSYLSKPEELLSIGRYVRDLLAA